MPTLRTTLLLPLLALPLLAASCAGAKDPAALTDQGYAELQAGDWADARASFEKALEDLDPADPQFVRAKLGQVEALVKLEPEAARDEFVSLAKAQPGRIEAKDFSFVAGKLTAERAFQPAIDVLHMGLTAHAESPKLHEVLESVKEQAQKTGDSAAIAQLKSLGYL